MYAHWSPARNDSCAAVVIWLAYFGCCSATAAALSKDLVSAASVLSDTLPASAELPMAEVNDEA